MKGYLNSYSVENGVFTVMMAGCTLRCAYCDIPACWEREKAALQPEAWELFAALQQSGAKTVFVSGGEPLEQAEFLASFFKRCRDAGITTRLDTPGSRINPEVEALLDLTDFASVHLKSATEESYRRFTGGSLIRATMFLDLLQSKQIPTAVRQLLVPGINDTPDNARFMKSLPKKYSCITECEFQLFRKGDAPAAYAALGMEYPMKAYPEADQADLDRMAKYH